MNIVKKFLLKHGIKKLKAKDALEIIKPIPADQFITDTFSVPDGKCCVIGHIGAFLNGKPIRKLGVLKDFADLSGIYLKEFHNESMCTIMSVNDYADINGYKEPVIKDRVIHLLEDMHKQGF